MVGRNTPRPLPVVFEPALGNWPSAGVYQLWLRVSVRVCARVGRLGRAVFPPARYVYTGRAARGLRARVLQHVCGGRRRHWHIDYLLARPEVRIERVCFASTRPEEECAVNQVGPGRPVAAGFGASDCRRGCGTHLRLIRYNEVGPYEAARRGWRRCGWRRHVGSVRLGRNGMVAMRDIRAFARRIAAEFKPRRIILFGSYAYGTPNEDSDVDLLVLMPYQGHAARVAGRILLRTDPRFAVDILVRSPQEVQRRYRLRDWFIREIIDQGKVLYEAGDGGVGGKSRSRLRVGTARVAGEKEPKL